MPPLYGLCRSQYKALSDGNSGLVDMLWQCALTTTVRVRASPTRDQLLQISMRANEVYYSLDEAMSDSPFGSLAFGGAFADAFGGAFGVAFGVVWVTSHLRDFLTKGGHSDRVIETEVHVDG